MFDSPRRSRYERMLDEQKRLLDSVERLLEGRNISELPEEIRTQYQQIQSTPWPAVGALAQQLIEELIIFGELSTVDFHFKFQIDNESVAVHVIKEPNGVLKHDFRGQTIIEHAIHACLRRFFQKTLTSFGQDTDSISKQVHMTERPPGEAIDIERVAVEPDRSPENARTKEPPAKRVIIAMTECRGVAQLTGGTSIEVPLPVDSEVESGINNRHMRMDALLNVLPVETVHLSEAQS